MPRVDTGPGGAPALESLPATRESFTVEERAFLLDLAIHTIRIAVSRKCQASVIIPLLTAKFLERRGCFVTLTRNGELRGCIGQISPDEPLWRAVMNQARSAATRDPRFPPVTVHELDHIDVQVSILTEPRILHFNSTDELLAQLEPLRDGVVLRIGARVATFLPQVWAQLPDKMDFLSNLSSKAGCGAFAWREPGTTVAVYQVECVP